MPLLHPADTPPTWCELRFYEVVRLAPGQRHVFPRREPKEKLIVGSGHCRIRFGGQEVDAGRGANLDLSGDGQFEVVEVSEPTTLVRMAGHWGDEIGGSGLFEMEVSETPGNPGDPGDYPRNTSFDRHYHDCDEYWILFEGRGGVISEGKHYEMGPDDCLAIGRGHHHDFPTVDEPVRAVYFETTLEGRKRLGHLWEHTHGPANPVLDRV